MDAESLAQIERIVSGAESRLRQEFGEKTEALGGSLRKEMGTQGSALRQELGEKMDALGGSLRKEISDKTDVVSATLRQEMGAQTEVLRKEMGAQGIALRQEMSEQGSALRQEIAEKFEAAERHSGVLHEDMLHRLDLVLEGFEGVRQGQAALRQTAERDSLELQALIKLSYRQLHERVESLEQRVQIIEKRLDRIN